ncbi:MAG: class I SAM-dependent methyltransferase [Planctomycetaceae bacterium]
MLIHLFGSAMHAAENGILPDKVCRAGIRRLLSRRLQDLESGGIEAQNNRFRSLLKECQESAIAVVPELANEQHYELPPEFFRTVLGKRLKSSCCEWSNDMLDLDQAEEAALATTCQRAQIEDGMTILELGCGWGSLSLWMAERFPSSRILGRAGFPSVRQTDRAGFVPCCGSAVRAARRLAAGC